MIVRGFTDSPDTDTRRSRLVLNQIIQPEYRCLLPIRYRGRRPGPLANLDVLTRVIDQVREITAPSASHLLRDPLTGDAVTRVAHLENVKEIRVRRGQGSWAPRLIAKRPRLARQCTQPSGRSSHQPSAHRHHRPLD